MLLTGVSPNGALAAAVALHQRQYHAHNVLHMHEGPDLLRLQTDVLPFGEGCVNPFEEFHPGGSILVRRTCECQEIRIPKISYEAQLGHWTQETALL